MANEITVSGSMTFQKGNVSASMGKSGVRADVAGTKYAEFVQEIGTSAEALELGDVGTPGYVMIENLDATNFVSLRPTSSSADMIKILPGEFAGPFMLAAAAPFAIANTAAVKIRCLLIEA
jgi:hypothetical protein